MTVQEFCRKYYLHDSLLEKVEFDNYNKTLTFWVSFCEFMQSNYKNGDFENSDRIFTFNNVEEFSFPHNIQLSSDIFLEQKITDENTVNFCMMSDCEPNVYQIKIRCQDVEIKVVRFYNL